MKELEMMAVASFLSDSERPENMSADFCGTACGGEFMPVEE